MNLFMRLLEIAGLIGFVGLILTHPDQFATVVKGAGKVYADTVRGLEGY